MGRYYTTVLMFCLLMTNAFAKQEWKGPAGAPCEFEKDGKKWTGTQYPTGTQKDGGNKDVVQGWGCRATQKKEFSVNPQLPRSGSHLQLGR